MKSRKESYRLSEEDIKQGYDIVVIARVSANGADYKETLVVEGGEVKKS